MATDPTDLTDHGASALSRLIHARRISCRETMQAYLDRIHRLNPALNAIVSSPAPPPSTRIYGYRVGDPGSLYKPVCRYTESPNFHPR